MPGLPENNAQIGEDISERLEFIPASLQVIEEVRPKYACARGCGVVAADKPAALIREGAAGAGICWRRSRSANMGIIFR